MRVSSEIYHTLMLVTFHRNDATVVTALEELDRILDINKYHVSEGEIRRIKIYRNIIKEIVVNRILITTHRSSIEAIIGKYSESKGIAKDKSFLERLNDSLKEDVDEKRLENLLNKITNFIIWHKANRTTRRLFGILKTCETTIDIEEQEKGLEDIIRVAEQLKKELTEVSIATGTQKVEERIDMSNKEDIEKAYNVYKERKVAGVLKTGLQGVNMLFGKRGGIALGESVICCALAHNFKSSMLMSFAQWITKYNTPPPTDKKPIVLFITLENEAFENMMVWFEKIYYYLNGETPGEVDHTTVINTITDYFDQRDIGLVVERYLPSTLGFDDLCTLIEKYEESGFHIVACIIDYMQHMKKVSDGTFSSLANHLLIQQLFNKVCNYTKSKGITLISAHQLNRAAAEIASSGIPDPVKRFSDNHLAFCVDVAREPDVIIFMHIEKNADGVPFLTLKRGKHRYVNDTPEVHKYVAYELTSSGLVDDIDGEFKGTRNIHVNKAGQGGFDLDSIEDAQF